MSLLRPALRSTSLTVQLRALTLAPPALAPKRGGLKVATAGPLHAKKRTKKASKPKAVSLSTQIRQARAALSSDAQRALDRTPSAYNLYIKQAAAVKDSSRPHTETFAEVARAWPSLSDSEKSSYVQQAESLKAERDSAAQSLSEEDVKAVRHLTRLENKKAKASEAKSGKKHDKVHRGWISTGSSASGTNVYAQFVADNYKDSDVQAVPVNERFKKLAEKWKQQKSS